MDAAERQLESKTPPELATYVEPDDTTALAFMAWRWVSRHRPPASIGLGGALHSPIPSYWIDYWLERKAGLDEGAFLGRLLWHLLEVMDQMFLEHHNRPAGDEGDKKDPRNRP